MRSDFGLSFCKLSFCSVDGRDLVRKRNVVATQIHRERCRLTTTPTRAMTADALFGTCPTDLQCEQLPNLVELIQLAFDPTCYHAE